MNFLLDLLPAAALSLYQPIDLGIELGSPCRTVDEMYEWLDKSYPTAYAHQLTEEEQTAYDEIDASEVNENTDIYTLVKPDERYVLIFVFQDGCFDRHLNLSKHNYVARFGEIPIAPPSTPGE